MNRHTNIELLRIISMLLIIMHHYSVHGGFILDPSMVSSSKIIVQFLSAGGKLGVDCFILITGYFLIKSSFKLEKLLKLSVSIFTYSFPIYVIFYTSGLIDFNLKQALKSFFPIIFGQYWFATSYVLLYIFSPFINIFIKNLDRKNHLNLIIVLIFVWSIVPTFTTADLNFSSISWFSTLYIIAAYIRLYQDNFMERFDLKMSAIAYLLILFSIVFFDIAGMKFSIFGSHATYFTGINKLPLLFCAVTLFIGFKNYNIKNVKLINIISSSMFGVYLIHDNSFVRKFLWIDVFKNNQYYQSDYLILHAVAAILLVFTFCIIIDQAKRILIERPFLQLFETVLNSKFILLLMKRFAVLAESRR